MEDPVNDFGTALKDRIVGPFSGYFILSWIAINHKFLIAVFSDGSLYSTFEAINALHPNGLVDYLWRWVLTPFFSAAVVLFVVPVCTYCAKVWAHKFFLMFDSHQHENPPKGFISPQVLLERENKFIADLSDLTSRASSLENKVGSLSLREAELMDELKLRITHFQHIISLITSLSDLEKAIINVVGKSPNGALSDTEIINGLQLAANQVSPTIRALQLRDPPLLKDDRTSIKLTRDGQMVFNPFFQPPAANLTEILAGRSETAPPATKSDN